MDEESPSWLQNTEAGDAKERLVRAVLLLWEELPGSEISVRRIAQKAGTALSAVDYHYGSLGQLYADAQNRALAEAEAWAEARAGELAALKGAELGAAAVAAVVASIIDEWTECQRPLAMAWREAAATAHRINPRVSPAEWNAIWARFWTRTAEALGRADQAELLMAFFLGEAAQHLLRWNRLLDRALLDETAAAFADRTSGRPSGAAPIRSSYSDLAQRGYAADAETATTSSGPLEAAAADILREEGVSGLTFRAVADRAGTTLGYASYRFGSKTRMLKAAFEQVYELGWSSDRDDGKAPPREELMAGVVAAISAGDEPILRALNEITLHICRSDDYHGMRGVIRSFPDPAASWVLKGLLHTEEPISPSLSAAFSSICRGLHQLGAGLAPEVSRDLCRRALRQFLGLDVRDSQGR